MKNLRILLFILLAISINSCTEKKQDLCSYVNPFIGTAGHGHTYPGASMPFGMVQLSPDTRLSGWDGCSGYHYSDSVIFGFSHTHLSGTGVADYCDILFMPTSGDITFTNDLSNGSEAAYPSKFSHNNEIASPGYYSVILDDYNIKSELTVTERTGFHKYTSQSGKPINVILDLEHRDKVLNSGLTIVSNNEIQGYRISSSWAKKQHIYFVAQFSQDFEQYSIYDAGETIDDSLTSDSEDLKAVFSFPESSSSPLMIKIGISAVDIEGARRNLKEENPDWDFNQIQNTARETWNKQLGKISVEGGGTDKKSIFYTALYHCFLAPNIFMDVDGRFRGTDLKIHKENDFTNYTVFSLWDTYRALHPLFTILEQGRTNDFIKTFLKHYEYGGQLPVWELAANYTGCMIGYHAVSVIADAYKKGIRNYDTMLAYEAMKKIATTDELGKKEFGEYGYIPSDMESESVSKTLEYAYNDWCIAMMAKELNNKDDYKYFIQRAQNFKNIYDPQTGFMRAKRNSTWLAPFDPKEVNFNYTEANSWQYSFYAPQDIKSLINMMGGEESFKEKLIKMFNEDSRTSGRQQADITGLIGQYAHGNEPSHHMAYLFNYCGAPSLTQKTIHQILNEFYANTPDGLCGNEDCGQMSAWYVLSSMGFYPVCPGNNTYILGSPIFDKVTIHLENGNDFIIKAQKSSKNDIYVENIKLNEKEHPFLFIRHDSIMNGGELLFYMSDFPDNTDILSYQKPTSEIKDYLINPRPFFYSHPKTFINATSVKLGSINKDTRIYYTIMAKNTVSELTEYVESIKLKNSATINAFAEQKNLPRSKTIKAKFLKIPSGRSISYNSMYNTQYTAGGEYALIDYIYGAEDFRTGAWQGFYGDDMDVVLDLGKLLTIKKVSAGFLQDNNSWIFFPEKVTFEISTEGETFHTIGEIISDISPETPGAMAKRYSLNNINKHARYIHIIGKNRGLCPEWHKGAGNKAWIFADEIYVNN